MDLAALEQLAKTAPREDVLGLLGQVVTIEAQLRLRLTEAFAGPSSGEKPAARIIDDTEAATIAGTSRRWLNAETSGQRFRHDLSRKQKRYDEQGFRRWLADRKGR